MAPPLSLTKARYAAAQSARVAWYMAHYSITKGRAKNNTKAEPSNLPTANSFPRTSDPEGAQIFPARLRARSTKYPGRPLSRATEFFSSRSRPGAGIVAPVFERRVGG